MKYTRSAGTAIMAAAATGIAAATVDENSSRPTLTPQATPVASAPAQAQFIGAGIGLAVAGGPPLLDSAMTFSGQP